MHLVNKKVREVIPSIFKSSTSNGITLTTASHLEQIVFLKSLEYTSLEFYEL